MKQYAQHFYPELTQEEFNTLTHLQRTKRLTGMISWDVRKGKMRITTFNPFVLVVEMLQALPDLLGDEERLGDLESYIVEDL